MVKYFYDQLYKIQVKLELSLSQFLYLDESAYWPR